MSEVIEIRPSGVCSSSMRVEHENGIITHVSFINGCRGNLQGIGALLIGYSLEEAVKRLEGIQCRNGTSCPDQLAKGIKQYLNNK